MANLVHTDQFKAVQDAILVARTVFLTSHVNPDGDTLGSMLAFKAALESHFPHLTTIHGAVSGPIASIYDYLPGRDEIINSDHPQEATQLLDTPYDLSFSFDCGAADRLGLSAKYFTEATQSINVDHHITNQNFGDINIVLADDSASGQVVARILQYMEIPWDRAIAINLYTTLLTDTGGFRYSNTTPEILRLAAEFIDAGADPALIYKQIYEETPWCQIELQANAVLNAQFNAKRTLAWSVMSRQSVAQFGAKEEHLEGLVEALRRVNTVKIAAVIKENANGTTKVSLRSDDSSLHVSNVAEDFGGGGHKMAAGFSSNLPLAEVEKMLIPKLEALLENHSA